MTFDEIRAAVDAGKVVYWRDNNSRVVKEGADYLILHRKLNHTKSGLAGNPLDFYVADEYWQRREHAFDRFNGED